MKKKLFVFSLAILLTPNIHSYHFDLFNNGLTGVYVMMEKIGGKKKIYNPPKYTLPIVTKTVEGKFIISWSTDTPIAITLICSWKDEQSPLVLPLLKKNTSNEACFHRKNKNQTSLSFYLETLLKDYRKQLGNVDCCFIAITTLNIHRIFFKKDVLKQTIKFIQKAQDKPKEFLKDVCEFLSKKTSTMDPSMAAIILLDESDFPKSTKGCIIQ